MAFNASTAVVRWRPGYDGGYPQEMEVWYRLSSDNDYQWTYSPRLGASVTSYRIPGLQASKPYLFSVRGINREGVGPFSEMVEAKGVPPELNRDPKKSGKKIGTMFITPLPGVFHLPNPLPLGRRGERHGNEVNRVEGHDLQFRFQDPRRGKYSPKILLFVCLFVSKAKVSISNFKT